MSGVVIVGCIAHACDAKRGLIRGRRIECRTEETRSMLEAAVQGVPNRRQRSRVNA